MKEQAFGVVPLRQVEGKWEVLLVLHQKGHWAFPKGHAETGETPEQTAVRELKEETGLHLSQLLPHEPLSEHYVFERDGGRVEKWVLYFLGEVAGQLHVQEEEIVRAQWMGFEKARETMTYPEGKKLVEKVRSTLSPESV